MILIKGGIHTLKAGSQYDAASCVALVCEMRKFLIKNLAIFGYQTHVRIQCKGVQG